MKTIKEITEIIEALSDEEYCSLYTDESALEKVGLTKEEFDLHCLYEDRPEGDVPEDWADPDWDE